MAKKYPDVMAMVCSGGGGRVDYGALKYFDSFWPSDNTDPRQPRENPMGLQPFLPGGNHRGARDENGQPPAQVRGGRGDERRAGTWTWTCARCRPRNANSRPPPSPSTKRVCSRWFSRATCTAWNRPTTIRAPRWITCRADLARAVLFVYQLKEASGEPVKPRGLDPQRNYRVLEVNLPEGAVSQLAENDKVIAGATLLRDGLVPPCRKEYESSVIELVAEPAAK